VHRPCEKSHDRNCIQFNRGAEYAIVRGSGRELSVDEALATVDETEEHGLVHSWSNTRSMVGVIMCNCCYDCCVDWARLRHHGVPISRRWEKSRFEARVDTAACTGCQTCVERCQFEAIAMTPVAGSKKLKAAVDPEKCWGCGVCALSCAADAIRLEVVRPLEHIPDLAAP
jgi:Pyruvate/2-oxoacid:ferredoxin oxidoreductase delta subunit